MTMVQDRLALTLSFIALVVLALFTEHVSSFSDGSKLAKGFSATRSVFCHRSTNKRQPLHFNSRCNGYCEPNRHGELYYDMDISASTYWLDLITINITANEDSDRAVTGFSIYAVDESNMVAGSFVEDENNIIVGSCGDILAYNQETHGAFHKMADHTRRNITLKFQPDGFNHGQINFIVWIVNNHSDIHFLESQPLTPSKNGSTGLDLSNVLRDLVSDVDIKAFEKSFEYRKKLGYRLDLDNPFSLFDTSPDVVSLIPLNMTISANTVHKSAKAMDNIPSVHTSNNDSGVDSSNGYLPGPDVPVSEARQDAPFVDLGAAGSDIYKLFSDDLSNSADSNNSYDSLNNLFDTGNNQVYDSGNQGYDSRNQVYGNNNHVYDSANGRQSTNFRSESNSGVANGMNEHANKVKDETTTYQPDFVDNLVEPRQFPRNGHQKDPVWDELNMPDWNPRFSRYFN
ncbi:uncharacterized protein LOC106059158 [Biomphalaria glabrata]|uniref:Uncharacterized protein LOC106059158 n=1 Tax=Biomphalaria glabrata TaxID=6526 RepID=A0A9W2YQB4_BIOGL|nr:uncharacterized protein LOC106059158 [Biomphalaria glabrata]